VAKSCLEGDGSPITRCSLSGLCGGDGYEHLPLPFVWLGQEGTERAYCSVPRNRGKNTTLLSSMSMDEGMGPSLAVEGTTNSQVFETYVEWVLAPSLRKGQMVIMDNLWAHKGERVKELIEQRGCQLCYICRPTHRTSTPSRRHSARSRG
jgi:hypothetical protein